MRNSLVVIVQTSSNCNLNCGYCYARASRISDHAMSAKQLSSLIRNCANGHRKVNFCWHGGEPLLAGLAFYQEAVGIQRELTVESGIEFKNSIQTNGTLLTDEWLKFFRENGFSLGVSFDAPPDVDQQQRVGKGKGASSHYIINVAEKLRANNMAMNFLCVVTELNVARGEEIFNFFSSLGAHSYSLLPVMETSLPECPRGPTNEELFKLYATTFELWLGGGHNFRVVDPIDTMVKSLIGGGTPGLCSFSSVCLESMVTITPDGNVVPCGSFTAPEFVLGNAFDKPVIEAIQSERAAELRRLRAECVSRNCFDCDFLPICRGGCREAAFWDSGRYDGNYPYCEARKKTFAYIKGRIGDELNKARL